MNDDTRIEAAARAIYDTWATHPTGESTLKPWMDNEDEASVWQDTALLLAEHALAAADAVGRERVSEAGIDAAARVLADIDRLGYWDIAKEEYRNAYRRDAARVLDAYLTAAPPERHDAPGVSVKLTETTIRVLLQSLEAKTTAITQAWDGIPATEKIHQRDIEREHIVRIIMDALTGQPDAGRDPDAADAGGE